MDSRFFFESTMYWSEGDERAHFEWLERISCVKEVRGKGNRVYLQIDEAELEGSNLQELHAVYRRFGGDRSQLPIAREAG